MAVSRQQQHPLSTDAYIDITRYFLILAFLPTLKDAVHAISVNKTFRALFYNRSFWQQQLARDFHFKAPRTVHEPRLFYQQTLTLMEEERKITLSFLGAYQFTTRVGALRKPEKYKQLNDLAKALAKANKNHFLQFANQALYGFSLDRVAELPTSRLHIQWDEWINPRKIMAVSIDVSQFKPLVMLPNKINREFSATASFFMVGMAMTNAHKSLNYLLHQLSEQQRLLFLNKIGADMLCQAARMGHLETVKLLLECGANPNEYGLYLDAGERQNLRRTIALPLYFLHEWQQTKGIAIKKNSTLTAMIQLFLQYKANVDLPAKKELEVAPEVNDAATTLRSCTQTFLATLAANENQYNKTEYAALKQSVTALATAPAIEEKLIVMRYSL